MARLRLESTINAADFYERLGYRREGENRWQLGEGDVPNIIMGKPLA